MNFNQQTFDTLDELTASFEKRNKVKKKPSESMEVVMEVLEEIFGDIFNNETGKIKWAYILTHIGKIIGKLLFAMINLHIVDRSNILK